MKSYCLKVKEMDDEEYSCIVSTSTVAMTTAYLVSAASLPALPSKCKSPSVPVCTQTSECVLRITHTCS